MPKLALSLLLPLLAFTTLIRAEDPLLGIVREVKCLNCIPDSVELLAHDPIEGRDMLIRVPTREYNKVLQSLSGRPIFVKPDSGCFYWRNKLKTPNQVTANSHSDSTGAESSAIPEYRESTCLSYSSTSLGIR